MAAGFGFALAEAAFEIAMAKEPHHLGVGTGKGGA